ncbi:hypothetical protein IT087_04330 [Candidatus Uhrbacteria bacterium]|nr:hypothetical protein [Candidatus Uhrbacteria bacterium]
MQTINNAAIVRLLLAVWASLWVAIVALPAHADATRYVAIDQAELTETLGVCEPGYRATVFVTHDQFQSVPGATLVEFRTPSYETNPDFGIQFFCGTRRVAAPSSAYTVH